MGTVDSESAKKRLILALDAPDLASAAALLDRLEGRVGVVKVGLELFAACGPAAVESVQARGYDVFLDLKLHDIPNTVAGAVRSANGLGVSMLTVHTGGTGPMLEAAAAAAGASLKLLGVTLLTSIGQEDLAPACITGTPASIVESRAALAAASGLGGIVCSPKEIAAVRARIGADMSIVTPGIRPGGAEMGDQKRAATPASAIGDGADYLVVGRPISQAADPAASTAPSATPSAKSHVVKSFMPYLRPECVAHPTHTYPSEGR